MIPVPADIHAQVAAALSEDIGTGDVTAGLIAQDAQAQASLITREDIVLSGAPWLDAVFGQLDADIEIDWRYTDGERVTANQALCTLSGHARPLLAGERTALNFLQTLSATATLTARYVEAVSNTKVRILDTRKTLPGLRRAQKYAVLCGGGHNHRMGLDDAILIKENHIKATGSIGAALAAARATAPKDMMIEIEVESLAELTTTLDAGARRILLDNFTLGDLKKAVSLCDGRATLEASGGVTLATISAIASTGVDFISVGALTKDIKACDLSLRFT